jgi:hypothetical protein
VYIIRPSTFAAVVVSSGFLAQAYLFSFTFMLLSTSAFKTTITQAPETSSLKRYGIYAESYGSCLGITVVRVELW